MKLTQRGSHFYAVKRVPKRFLSIEYRRQVWIALRTDSRKEAERRAGDALRDLENLWMAKLAGDQPSAHRFDALSALAASRGFPYLPAEKLASRSLDDILARIKVAKENQTLAAAVLGEQNALSYKLSDLVPLYLQLVAVEVKEKSPDQRRIWQNTLHRSMGRLMKIIGDKPIDTLCREDVLNFRAHWAHRIEEEGLSPTSANRELTAIGGVFSRLHKLKGIGDPALFRNLAFSAVKQRRPPYEQSYIRDFILPCLNSGILNQDASAILKILINTGMRPSEVTGLAPEDINLDHEVPHVLIRPRTGRELKTQTSIRDIPLVGIAWDACREFPQGFARYGYKSGSLSQTINKFLRVQNLQPTPDHCLYSFRHGFQDRLTAVEAPDRIQADLMGHRYVRERYGRGPSLHQKAEWLSRVAFF